VTRGTSFSEQRRAILRAQRPCEPEQKHRTRPKSAPSYLRRGHGGDSMRKRCDHNLR
jgi:hypothetical protein